MEWDTRAMRDFVEMAYENMKQERRGGRREVVVHYDVTHEQIK